MRFTLLTSLTLSILLAGLLGACDDSGTDNGNDIEFPEQNVSYSQHVQPYFNLYCATAGCHDNGTMAGGLSLTSYFNTTNNPGIVIPGDPDASVLIQKVDGRLPHEGFVPIVINDNQLQGLKTWVAEGAKNN